MAIIKKKEMSKMADKELNEKIKELKFELAKSTVTANKTNSKTREIKRTLARLYTIKSLKGEVQNK